MDDDVVIEEELIEASGEPEPTSEDEPTGGKSTGEAPPEQNVDADAEGKTIPPDDTDIEKAGRKISAARLARLKKLLDELKSLIEEVEGAVADGGGKSADASRTDKLSEIETTVAAIAKSLGLDGEVTGKDAPSLAKVVEDLTKRVATLEGMPGQRTSLDGQESLPDEGGSGSMWKGLV